MASEEQRTEAIRFNSDYLIGVSIHVEPGIENGSAQATG